MASVAHRRDVVEICADLIRFDTSNPGSTEADAAEYIAAQLDLAGVPTARIEPEPGRTTLIAWHRTSTPSPHPGLLVHGHLDTVPATAAAWSLDPFSGIERHGYLWGRGAVDMKGFVACMLAVQLDLAANELATSRDICFAYFADEEMGGTLGSRWIVENQPSLLAGISEAVSEVGGFTVTLPTGHRLYPLATAERGLLWLRVAYPGTEGHVALSTAPNPVQRVADFIQRVAELSIEHDLLDTHQAMTDALSTTVGKQTPTDFAALGPFASVIKRGQRTSFVPTILRAGSKANVVPSKAEVTIDCRFVPGLQAKAYDAIVELLDPDATIEVLASAPGRESPIDGPVPRACALALHETDPAGAVLPYVLPAGTDNQHLSTIGINGYGFTPFPAEPSFDFISMFHANDERIPVKTLRQGHQGLATLIAHA